MIVFPMAGLSSRFFKAGYNKPKYMLEAHGRPLFDFAVGGFSRYFGSTPFLFICRSDFDTPDFVSARCEALGIQDFQIVTLDRETRGQAETVALGLEKLELEDQPITIFNIDTFRPDFTLPALPDDCAGYLEVFRGSGSNWSYAKPASEQSLDVVETAEKNPISNLCSTGLYHFSSASDFLWAFEQEQNKPADQLTNKELYIAPMYNLLIQRGQRICYDLIQTEQVLFCGVPDEYLQFLEQPVPTPLAAALAVESIKP